MSGVVGIVRPREYNTMNDSHGISMSTPETSVSRKDSPKPRSADVFPGIVFREDCSRMEDFEWLESVEANGGLAPYRGHKIAVLNKTVVGFGDNGLELRDAVCREYHVPAHRPVISYVCGEAD